MSPLLSEEALGPPVVAWLEERGWDVYQEVEFGGPVADLVAVQGRLVWVVEMKRALTFAVIAQAAEWRKRAHYASVAVPQTERYDAGRGFAYAVLEWKGLGLFTVAHGYATPGEGPTLNRHAKAEKLRAALRPEHKTHARAGTAGGGHWTSFRGTCEQLRRFVVEHPGCTLKDAVAEIDHHYRRDTTARSSLATWIRKGIVKGVELRDDMTLYVEPREGKE